MTSLACGHRLDRGRIVRAEEQHRGNAERHPGVGEPRVDPDGGARQRELGEGVGHARAGPVEDRGGGGGRDLLRLRPVLVAAHQQHLRARAGEPLHQAPRVDDRPALGGPATPTWRATSGRRLRRDPRRAAADAPRPARAARRPAARGLRSQPERGGQPLEAAGEDDLEGRTGATWVRSSRSGPPPKPTRMPAPDRSSSHAARADRTGVTATSKRPGSSARSASSTEVRADIGPVERTGVDGGRVAEHVRALVVTERHQLGCWKARAQVAEEGQGEDHVADAALQEDQDPFAAFRFHPLVSRLPALASRAIPPPALARGAEPRARLWVVRRRVMGFQPFFLEKRVDSGGRSSYVARRRSSHDGRGRWLGT